ncbi:unnamed protein product [marine sediment metagenome]|uniref:Uncharacterized protein n=1 Tax=marine sediment metagenome TaxID=412755 RepID=X1AWK8_9ZZZZ
MYRERLLTRPDARDMLIELGYAHDEVTYLLDLYAQETATKTRDLTLSQVKNLYQRGIRNKSQVTVFLTAFGFSAAEIIALYELWDWEKPIEDKEKGVRCTHTKYTLSRRT